MLLETFVALMKLKRWDLQPPVDYSNSASPDGPLKINQEGQMGFRRSNFFVWFDVDDIEKITEELFHDVFRDRTKGFHFFDDWKDNFVGSEFLIPLAEEEIKIRERMVYQNMISKVYSIKNGNYTCDQVIKDLEDLAYKN